MLPGYGVEAVLKNMEYSAMDDKAKADAAAAAKKAAAKAAAGGGGEDAAAGEVDVSSLGEVKGFKFDVLAQRKPHLVQELMTFRDVLMSNDEEETIKVGGWALWGRCWHACLSEKGLVAGFGLQLLLGLMQALPARLAGLNVRLLMHGLVCAVFWRR